MNQVFGQIVIEKVVEASDGGIDAPFGQEFLQHLGWLGEHEFHSDLKREFAAPDFGDQISTAVAGGLPQSQQAADFVMVQQAVRNGAAGSSRPP